MDFSEQDLAQAQKQIDSLLHKLRETVKTLEGKENSERYKAQITLAKRRIAALEVAGHFIAQQPGTGRLTAFEAMLSSVQEQYRNTTEKMDRLKAEGREKSATFRQLMGTKLQLQQVLSMYRTYGLLHEATSTADASSSGSGDAK